jgi:hypothetical protein
MNSPSWMRDAELKPRKWVRRSRGRRAGDRALRLEAVLGAGVILAWTWGVYEVTLLFLK